MKLAILIPCYNEGERLRQTVLDLDASLALDAAQMPDVREYFIVAVDDGSKEKISLSGLVTQQARCFLLHHPINLGQGAALQTALNYAVQSLRCDYFVTMDADGQHDPKSIPRFVDHLRKNNLNIVFGNRFQASVSPNMPLSRKILLRAASQFERWITGLDLGDAHNGFRVFGREVAAELNLLQNRMAHATEFKQIIAEKKFRYGELPTPILYSDELMNKGQRNIGSAFILKDLIKTYLFNG